MKRISVYLFLFFLLVQLVFAGEIFNDEVKDNVPFYINSIKHIARYYPSAEKVSMLAGEERVLIRIEDCEELGGLQYCIDSASEGINEETGDPASTMELRVLQSGPELDVDRSISDDDPNINQEVEVKVTITNIGTERASNINYEDKFPSSVKISSAYTDYALNRVLWIGSLNPGQSDSFTYKIKFQEFITYESTGEASFIFNNKVNKEKTETTTFEVQTPYEISDSISSRSVSLNEEIEYNFSINNTASTEELNVKSVEITLPEGVTVTKRDLGLDKVNDKVTYSGTIPADSSETLSFRFKSTSIAQGDLKAKFELRVGSTDFTEELSHKIGIGISQIVPEIKFKPATVKGGAELEIEAKITNEGDGTISDISLDMTGDIVDPRGWRQIELDPGDHYYAFNKIINAPTNEEDRTYFLKISGSYLTDSGKVMDFEDRKELTVLAQEKLVELMPEVFIDGKDVNVTLKIKNVAPYKVTYVSLIDTFPIGFKSTGGKRYIDIDELAIGEERTAYSYVVTVPDNYAKPSFDITHTVNALDKDGDQVIFEKITAVVIGEAAGEAEEVEETAETEDKGEKQGEAAEEQAEEKKPGVFKRVWNWIKGLFSGDDSEEGPEAEEQEEETEPE